MSHPNHENPTPPTMLAATLSPVPPRRLSLSHPALPSPLPHEARLQILLSAICGTDLHLLHSNYKSLPSPLIPGHEFVAKIHSYHPSLQHIPPIPLHTRVVAEINCVIPPTNSRTAYDRAQDPGRTALGIFGKNGAFAQFCCVPIVNLHPVPDILPDPVVVFTEPIAAACRILEQICVPRVGIVAVLGAGRMGWLVAHVLAACGCRVVILSKGRDVVKDGRLARELGVETEVVNSGAHDVYEVIVDCTGSASGFQTAVRLVRPRGVLVLKSTGGEGGALDLSEVVVKEVRVVGSRCGPFEVALRLLERGVVRPEVLVEEVYELEEIERAFERANTKGVLKVLVRPPR